MKVAALIDALGGPTAVAHLVSIRAPSVSGWKDVARIPDDKLIRLAVIAEARGIATRKDLLPDLWRHVWPELVDAEHSAATAVPAGEGALA